MLHVILVVTVIGEGGPHPMYEEHKLYIYIYIHKYEYEYIYVFIHMSFHRWLSFCWYHRILEL